MTQLLAKLRVLTFLFASAVALAAPSVQAIDLVVHPSMIVKALTAQLFKDRGRYYLQRPDRCSDPYLENPTVSFKEGRVYVGAHFAGKIGALIAGACQSAAEPSAIVLSARPILRAQEAGLEDVRLEGADKPIVAAVLQNLIGTDLLSSLHIDLLASVRALTAPDKTAPYAIVVRALELSSLAVQNEELHITVQGAIEIR